MKRIVSFISFLALLALACGMSSSKPPVTSTPVVTSMPSETVTSTPPEVSAPDVTSKIVCDSGGLNIRAGSGEEYPPLDVIDDGTVVTSDWLAYVATDMGVWYLIEAGEGHVSGYVNSRYLFDVTEERMERCKQ